MDDDISSAEWKHDSPVQETIWSSVGTQTGKSEINVLCRFSALWRESPWYRSMYWSKLSHCIEATFSPVRLILSLLRCNKVYLQYYCLLFAMYANFGELCVPFLKVIVPVHYWREEERNKRPVQCSLPYKAPALYPCVWKLYGTFHCRCISWIHTFSFIRNKLRSELQLKRLSTSRLQRHGYGPLFQKVVNITIIFVVKFLHVSIYRLKETKTNMEYRLKFIDGHRLNNLIVRLLSKGPFHGWKRA